MKKISILGSTGSIGTQTLDVIRKNPSDFEAVAISANSNVKMILERIEEGKSKYAVMYEESKAEELKSLLPKGCETEVLSGMEGLKKISSLDEIDVVLTAVVGMIGLVPTMCAIESKKDIALANKETLVTAGELVMKAAKENGVKILPVDSEHRTELQNLNEKNKKDVKKKIITSYEAPFRGKKKEDLKKITKNEALKHPNWDMGRKISIDSSTLMNKGLEVIEAKWLFGGEAEYIDVVVHPQSIVHSMVQYRDSSVIAQLGCPDKRLPIQYALTYPDRMETDFERLDFRKASQLTFEEPDLETFPCLKLAYECLKAGGTYCTVLNAANEIVVNEFLEDRIGFYDIPKYIKMALDAHESVENATLEQILKIDLETREYVKELIKNN